MPKFCQQRSRVGLSRFLVLIFIFLVQFPVGEAANPGPGANVVDSHFAVGCCNPTGLGGKAATFAALMKHGDIWSV